MTTREKAELKERFLSIMHELADTTVDEKQMYRVYFIKKWNYNTHNWRINAKNRFSLWLKVRDIVLDRICETPSVVIKNTLVSNYFSVVNGKVDIYKENRIFLDFGCAYFEKVNYEISDEAIRQKAIQLIDTAFKEDYTEFGYYFTSEKDYELFDDEDDTLLPLK